MRHLRKEEHWVALDRRGMGSHFIDPMERPTRFLIGFWTSMKSSRPWVGVSLTLLGTRWAQE